MLFLWCLRTLRCVWGPALPARILVLIPYLNSRVVQTEDAANLANRAHLRSKIPNSDRQLAVWPQKLSRTVLRCSCFAEIPISGLGIARFIFSTCRLR